jgi:hypothetical protein
MNFKSLRNVLQKYEDAVVIPNTCFVTLPGMNAVTATVKSQAVAVMSKIRYL